VFKHFFGQFLDILFVGKGKIPHTPNPNITTPLALISVYFTIFSKKPCQRLKKKLYLYPWWCIIPKIRQKEFAVQAKPCTP